MHKLNSLQNGNKYHESVQRMWDEFIKKFPQYSGKFYTAWYFCSTEDCANKLAELTKQGIKRGTTSLYYWIETGKESLAKVGDISVITDWSGVAQCIIRIKKITILLFRDFDEHLAEIEGEGDKSLDYWRKGHIEFFKNDLSKEPVEFNEDMTIVFEEVETLFPFAASARF